MMLLLAALLPSLSMSPSDAKGAVRLETPRVEYRINEASASRSPWLDANGWKILRQPGVRFYYDVPADAASLAAAEAFQYGAQASIHTDHQGAAAFEQMLAFLKALPDADLPVLANIGVVDDGSAGTGEVLNLLTRRNLLYRTVTAPDTALDLNIRIGSKDYPLAEAANPSMLAQKIRSQLTDEKRLIRIYGSEVVVVRLLGNRDRVRVHLLNYGGGPVSGVRVRLLGLYPHATLAAFGKSDLKLQDLQAQDGATEFTVPELGVYTVIDLSR